VYNLFPSEKDTYSYNQKYFNKNWEQDNFVDEGN
jgi:hypothetical protein